MVKRCWWLVLYVVGGCFSPQFDDRHLTCGPDNLCPPGFQCVDGKCTSTGTKGDGGPGMDGDFVAPAAPQLMTLSPTSPANSNDVRIIGMAEPMADITVYADAACGGTAIGTGTAEQLASPGILVNVTQDATTSFTAKAKDDAGNLSPCSSAILFVEDSTAPPAPTISSTLPMSPSRSTTPRVVGMAPEATSITLYASSDCTGSPLNTGTVASDAFDVMVSVPAGVVTQLSATSRDAAANVSACSGTLSYQHDASAVAVPTIVSSTPTTPNNSSLTPMLSGMTEANAEVKVYTDAGCSGTPAGMATASGTGAFTVNVSVAANTATTFYAQAQDLGVGTYSACSEGFIYTHDAVAPGPPAVTGSTPTPPSNMTTPTITGTAEASSTVTLYTTSTCTTGSEAAMGAATDMGTFSLGVTLAADTTYYAKARDAAGNVSGCSASGYAYDYDASPPMTPTMLQTLPVSPSQTVNVPDVRGVAEASSTVRVYRTMDCTGDVAGFGTASSPAGTFLIGVIVPSNSTTTFGVQSTDAAGNNSGCATITYVHDSLAPTTPVLASSVPTSPSNMNSAAISGTTEASASVQLYSNDTCTATVGSPITANGSGAFTANVTVSANTSTTFYAKATDAALNVSECSSGFTYVEDSTAPAAPVLSNIPPSSTNTNPNVSGTAEASTTVRIYTNGNCSGSPAMMGTASGTGAFSFAMTVGMNTSTQYSVTATDAAGNASACSAPITYVHDNTAPNPPTGLASNPNVPSQSSTPTISGMAEAGSTVHLFTNVTCGGGVAATATANGSGAWSVAVTVGAGQTTFYARATDAANNPSACSTSNVTYTQDSVAPAPPTNLAVTPSTPSMSTTPTLTGNAETGASVKIYTNNTCTSSVVATITATGGAFSTMVTAGANQTTSYWATATDSAGNASACSTASASYINDSAAPGAPTMTGTNPGSPANDTTPTLTGTAEAGSTVRIYSVAGCGGTMLGSGVATGGNYSINVTVTDNVTTQFYMTATDAANNASACTTGLAYTADSIAPGLPSSLAASPASPANDTTPSIVGTNGVVGSTVTVYTNATCDSTVAGSITVPAGGAVNVPVSVGANSTTTFYVQASDAAGNESACSSGIIYIEDSSAPAMPTVTTVTSGPANNNMPTVGGNAETGSTVRIYSNATCATQVGTGSVVAAGGAYSLSVPVGDNSTTTFYARATDGAGNVSACSTTNGTFVEDSTPPTLPGSLTTTPLSPANYNTPSIAGTTSAGATVTAYSNMACSTLAGTTVAAGDGTFSLQVTVGDNTTTTFYLKATDAANNSSACTASIMYQEDSTGVAPPTLQSFNPASPNNADTTPDLTGTVGASGAGFTIKIYTTSNCSGSFVQGTADASGNFTINVTAGTNATTTFYATATNGASTTSPCSTGLAYTHDNQAPAAPTSLASSPVSPSNINTPTITGTATAGTTVRLYTDSGCTGGGVASGTANGSNQFTIGVPSGVIADNATVTFWANASDAAGNTSACSTSNVVYVEDSAAPSIPTVGTTTPTSPSSSDTTPVINGTSNGNTVKVYTTAACTVGAEVGTGPVTTGTFGIEVTVGANSSTTFYARAFDTAGNMSGCSTTSVTYVHDSSPPGRPTVSAVNPVGPANDNTPTVSGTAESGSTVTLWGNSSCTGTQLGSGPATAPTGAFAIDASVSDNTLNNTLYAKATDAAGNTGACSTTFVTYTEDSTPPGVPSMTGSNPTSPSRTSTTPMITGTAELGSTVRIYTSSTCAEAQLSGSGLANGTGGSFSVMVTAGSNTTTSFWAKALDVAGNSSSCTAAASPFVYIHDSNAPGIPALTGTTPASGSSSTTPTVNGTAESGSTVKLYSDMACTTLLASGPATGGNFAIQITVGANTNTAIRGTATDAAGNVSSCSATPLTYINDSTAPGVPNLTSINPASPSNNNNPVVTGTTSEANATIRFYTNNTCTSSVIGTGSSGTGGAFSIGVTIAADTSVTIYATASDAAGNTSACSTTSIAYTEDSQAPATPTALATTPATTATTGANNNMPSVSGTADANTTVKVFSNATCTAPHLASTTSTTTSWSVPVAVSGDVTTTLYANATDAAGNVSGCSAGVAYREDSTANPPTISSPTSPASPQGGTNTSPTISGTGEANATIQLFTNATCASPHTAQGTITASGSFALSVTVNSNSSTTFYGKIIDTAGNVSACSTTSVNYIHDSTPPTFAGATSAVATGTTSVLVSWASASDTFTNSSQMRYQVCWRNSPTASPCATGNVTVTGVLSYTRTGLAPGVRYWFDVRAIDQVGNASAYGGGKYAKTWGPGATIKVASGFAHSCALTSTGKVWCWGNNDAGQLGDGTTTYRSSPVEVNLDDIVDIAAGGSSTSVSHTCAVRADGDAFCWGDNTSGQLGNNTTTDSLTPVQIATLTSTTKIAAGGSHTCAIIASGTAYCWGENANGQLGNSDTTGADQDSPVGVSSIGGDVKDIDLGIVFSCAVLSNGTARCWGEGSFGRLGNGGTVDSFSPDTVDLASGDYAKSITAGASHACAVTTTGQMRCWGYNGNGQLGDDSTTYRTTPVNVSVPVGTLYVALSSVETASAGGDFTCASLTTGSTRCWGSGTNYRLGNNSTANALTPSTVTGSANVNQVAAGYEHACHLMGNGELQCWGYGGFGRLGTGNTTTATTPADVLGPYDVESGTDIESGIDSYTTCARLSNGRVMCWGSNSYGQLGDKTTTPRAYPFDYVVDVNSTALSNVTQVEMGENFACALLANGTVMCWGRNYNGQLGDGTNTDKNYAVAVSGVTSAFALSLGEAYACALVTEAFTVRTKCWGFNGSGQLGDGTQVDSNVALIADEVSGSPIAIATGGRTSYVVRENGNVNAWGYNYYGGCGDNTSGSTVKLTPVTVQTTSSTTLTEIVQVSATKYGACALTDGGGIHCWGYGAEGQLGNNTNAQTNDQAATVSTPANNIRAIFSGGYHNCMIRYTGTPYCWGRNTYGAVGNNTQTEQLIPVAATGLATATTMTGGYYHSCMLHSDGTAECWGQGDSGALGDNNTTSHNALVAAPVVYFP